MSILLKLCMVVNEPVSVKYLNVVLELFNEYNPGWYAFFPFSS